MASSSYMASAALALALLCLLAGSSSAKLTPNFYSKTCPKVFSAILPVVKSAISAQKRNGASLLRLFFHDCFVNGCDGSILLDDTKTFQGEKQARPNNNSARGFEYIDKAKTAVEKVCPGVVSCADILAIMARDSIVVLGGPNWSVKVGRKDSLTANITAANTFIPAPTSNLTTLISKFKAVGLSAKDMVALSGAHTIGKAHCRSYKPHIYNDANINKSFAKLRQANCPNKTSPADNNLAPEDLHTENIFDNYYYKNLVKLEGLLHSDQVLFNNDSADAQVQLYAKSQSKFFSDFVTGMINMGDIRPPAGVKGQIRKNCRMIN